jgi:hypothetical protein
MAALDAARLEGLVQMAVEADFVGLDSRECSGILNVSGRGGSGMRGAGSMAGFAGMAGETLVRILLDYLMRTGQNAVVEILVTGLAGL